MKKVIDYRWFFRSLLVQGIILNTRPPKSAAAYKTVDSRRLTFDCYYQTGTAEITETG